MSRRDERGAVAGLDGVMFGVLVMVTGTLLVCSAWSVLQVRRTLDGAAREYLRAYTEADGPDAAAHDGHAALAAVIDGESSLDRSGPRVRVTGPDPSRFGPCATATVEVAATVPAVRLPFVGSFGSTDVVVTHTEMIDAHREMAVGAAYEIEDTPCG